VPTDRNASASTSSAASAAARCGCGPPTAIHASFTCGRPTVFEAPPSVNDSTSALVAMSVIGLSASSG
jgi:hypothetical protein